MKRKNKVRNAFDVLLDAYQGESRRFYIKLLKQLEIQKPTIRVLKVRHKLMEYAFAYLCMDYLERVGDYYPHEDIPLFIEEMGLNQHLPEIYLLMLKEGIPVEIDDIETLHPGYFEDLIIKYRKEWGRLLKAKYKNEVQLMAVFSDGIFGKNAPYGFEVADRAMGFVQEL
jgi:hypothetical protein